MKYLSLLLLVACGIQKGGLQGQEDADSSVTDSQVTDSNVDARMDANIGPMSDAAADGGRDASVNDATIDATIDSCVERFLDEDGDGYGDPNRHTCEGGVDNGDDCLDTDARVHPGAPDVACDDIDQNCNGNQPACPTTCQVVSHERRTIAGEDYQQTYWYCANANRRAIARNYCLSLDGGGAVGGRNDYADLATLSEASELARVHAQLASQGIMLATPTQNRELPWVGLYRNQDLSRTNRRDGWAWMRAPQNIPVEDATLDQLFSPDEPDYADATACSGAILSQASGTPVLHDREPDCDPDNPGAAPGEPHAALCERMAPWGEANTD